MLKFSANLGMLFTEYPLPEAITKAKTAGFHAVECHFPYDVPPEAINQALQETGLEMLAINTRRGNAEDFGLAALPHRQDEARRTILEAITYARAIETKRIHIMAGITDAPDAENVFISNLRYAAAAAPDLIMMIEPINTHDVPSYMLASSAQARRIITAANAPNIKMMFDCYHIAKMGEDIKTAFTQCRNIIAHIQCAGLPHRGAIHDSTIDYRPLFKAIKNSGHSLPIGAEYKPKGGDTLASLDWLRDPEFNLSL